ncbi:MAG: hypothetical protein DRZ80_04990 [Thermoprotei archaeon]|nr:MAG: hypothetical protein DRZ80_04990 [Thermoprotei archaeon]
MGFAFSVIVVAIRGRENNIAKDRAIKYFFMHNPSFTIDRADSTIVKFIPFINTAFINLSQFSILVARFSFVS